MKKIYLSLAVAALCATGAQAQQINSELNELGIAVPRTVTGDRPLDYLSNRSILWNETFGGIGTAPTSTAGPTFTTANGTWTTAGADANVWKHSFYTTSGEWSGGTVPFAATTAADGFMLFDSDSVNFPVSPNYINLTGELISPAITVLGAETSALLIFDQDSRYCCGGANDISISVSSDGGVTWSPTIDAAPGLAANADFFTANGSSYQTAVNISAYAAGQASVMIKFKWDGNASGNSHYYWNIDDICVLSLPNDDVQLLSAWAIGDNNNGMEYGITPEDMQDANYLVGAQVVNFGFNTQTNVTLNVTGSFVSTDANASVATGDTIILESTEAYSLAPAVYTGDYTVVSDQETGGAEFGNNVGVREFEISNPTSTTTAESSIYALDGVGVYTSPITSSIGTGSFTGGEDGLVIATEYRIKTASDVSGFRILLASGTVAGGDLICSLKDTASFRANDMTSLFSTQTATVSAANVTAGFIDVFFDNVENVSAGAYYASVELYSNANANDIVVVDDETVAQPSLASMIYLPGDQSYTNGVASGVRLLMGAEWYVGLNEEFLAGISVYPNPSEGEVTITNESGTVNEVIVLDLVGNIILSTEVSTSTTIDLSTVSAGMYVVKVSNGTATYTENVVIK